MEPNEHNQPTSIESMQPMGHVSSEDTEHVAPIADAHEISNQSTTHNIPGLIGHDLPPEEDSDNNGIGIYIRDGFYFLWETFRVLIISLLIIIPIRYFLVQPFFVKGASMENTFHDGEYILIDEISYRLHDPARGDITVFRFPLDQTQFFIKRVVGLPGETVQVRNNTVTIFSPQNPSGTVLKEPYLSEQQVTLGDLKVTLGPAQYFVMGDNRLRSSDSRSWGVLDRDLITGRVFFRAWPLSKFGQFKDPVYNIVNLGKK